MNDQTPDPHDDWQLMAAIAQGDAAAFARLARRHGSWALRFAERLLGERAMAEDVVQQAFLRLWEQAERWQPQARFSTWFYRVLYNLVLDQQRRQAGRQFEPLDEELPDGQPTIMETLLDAERERSVRDALASLPERQRAAIVLCYYEGMSQAQAAATLGISEGALESLLTRGRNALKNRVRQHLH